MITSSQGAGLDNDGGMATLTDCTISGNSNGDGGGVLNSSGTMTLTDCTVSNNSAHYGGGLDNNGGTMTLVGCTVNGNVAGGFDTGGGGGIVSGGTLTVTDCNVSGNGVFYDEGGGGLSLSGTAILTDCTISNNHAPGAAGVGGGGGVLAAGTVSLTGCTINGNSANIGGGFDNVSNNQVNLADCTINGNSASSGGGGVMNGHTLNLTGCTISDNSAPNGGGVDNSGYFGSTNLTNCTISGNSGVTGGGVDAHGGLYNAFTSKLTACTVSVNSATNGGGLEINGPTTLTDAIVAGNSLPNSLIASDIGGGQSVSGSYNLLGTGGQGGLPNGVNGNIYLPSVSDLDLAPLGDYGGLTQTMALLPGSWAIGKGTAVSGVTTDQRGEPLDSPVPDIGAFQNQTTLIVNTTSDGTGSTAGRIDAARRPSTWPTRWAAPRRSPSTRPYSRRRRRSS